MLKDFKEFAFKGNLIDMAVGIIIGGAFGTVVKSLVDNIFMPPLGMLIAAVDFKNMKYVMKEAVPEGTKDAAGNAIKAAPESAITYGQFITDFIAFLLVAFAVFLLVKKVLDFLKREKNLPAEPPAPSTQEKLLMEIRDLMKEQQGKA